MQILESGGQEGAEGSRHPDGLSLREAQEVGAADAPHGAGLRAVQGDQVELRGQFRLVSSLSAETRSANAGAVPPGLRCDGGPGSLGREVFVEW